MAVRSSYAVNYDFPGSAAAQSAANVPPFGGGVSLTGNIPFDDPYRGVPGGSILPNVLPPPHDAAFPVSASYSAIDPNINSIRVQSWNVTVERQIGASWQVSGSYLGSYIDRIWGPDPINAGVYLGLGPCTLQGVFFPVCSTTANLASRRALTLENPVDGRYLASVFNYEAIGTQRYRGLKLSFQRRAARGVSLGGNYTVSHCETDSTYDGRFIQGVIYNKPGDTSYDLGNCPNNRRQIANFTVGAQTPRFDNAVLRAVASDWRVSGIVSAQIGQLADRDHRAGHQFHGSHGPTGGPGARQSVRRQDADQLSQPRSLCLPGARCVWDVNRAGVRRAGPVERQHGPRASRAGRRRTDAGTPRRGVQPAEPFQLG